MVKLGVLSDLHGNKVALETVWHELHEEHNVDETAVAGDIVGVIGWPEDVAHFVKENVDHVVYGNHDAYVREDHPYVPEYPSQKQEHNLVTGKLTESTAAWLNDLPEQVTIDGDVVMAHARPWSDNPTGFPADNYLDMGHWIEWAADSPLDGEMVITGHTHEQGKLTLDKFEGQSGTMVNPGSVGAPYYEDPKYAVVDTETHEVELYRTHVEEQDVKSQLDKLGLKSAEELNKMSTRL